MLLHLTPSLSGNPRMINGFSQRDIQAENCCLLLFFEVFPEYIPKPLSTKVENNSTSAVSTRKREKKVGEGVGAGTKC